MLSLVATLFSSLTGRGRKPSTLKCVLWLKAQPIKVMSSLQSQPSLERQGGDRREGQRMSLCKKTGQVSCSSRGNTTNIERALDLQVCDSSMPLTFNLMFYKQEILISKSTSDCEGRSATVKRFSYCQHSK